MGKLWTFRFFDGSVERIRDGGLGAGWAREWALAHLPIRDIWQVSALNFQQSAVDFFMKRDGFFTTH